jgi:hypothetical protein
MSREFISKKARNEFREDLVEVSLFENRFFDAHRPYRPTFFLQQL